MSQELGPSHTSLGVESKKQQAGQLARTCQASNHLTGRHAKDPIAARGADIRELESKAKQDRWALEP